MAEIEALVWAAALVADREPAEVLATADVALLIDIAEDVAALDDPVEAAALLLVRLVGERPFAGPASAIGWLAAVDVLRVAGRPVRAEPREVRRLCRSLRGSADDRQRAVDALRRWSSPPGIPCPACGRCVYADDPTTCAIVRRHATTYELTARCAYEHRAHGRSGRELARAT